MRGVKTSDQKLLKTDCSRRQLSLRVPCDTDGALAERERDWDVAQLRMLDPREFWQEAHAKSRRDES